MSWLTPPIAAQILRRRNLEGLAEGLEEEERERELEEELEELELEEEEELEELERPADPEELERRIDVALERGAGELEAALEELLEP